MSAIQSTYKENIEPYVVGQLINAEASTLVSRTTVGALPFGRPVSPDAAGDRSVHLTTTGDTKVEGISVINAAAKSADGNSYADGDDAAIMRKGLIPVLTEGAVNRGDPVTVTAATGTFTTGTGIAVAAVYRTTLGAAGIALIDINIP